MIFFWVTIAILNVVRFLGLESSPPGFYADESAGAAHVMCLHQTGADFYGHSYPLFARAISVGYSTGPFLYGELLWTDIFGNSVYAYRAFIAFITTATIFFLYDWVRKRVSMRAALFVTLFASISPWAFQFSRIAWDPPLAPFFLILGLWCLDIKKSKAWIFATLSLALAAYSYPPARIQVVILLAFLPGQSWRRKLQIFGVFLLANIPMFYQAWTDPDFTARGKLVALTSDYSQNPYRDAGIFGLAGGFISQFFSHFSPDFLLVSGDRNLRHSSQWVGELSWPEAFLEVAAFFTWAVTSFRKKKFLFRPVILFSLMGIASGIAPAALTWLEIPHALRSIGAWPFFALLSGLSSDYLIQKLASRSASWVKPFQYAVLGSSIAFAAFYFYGFFEVYPERSVAWFQTDGSPISAAYSKMTELNVFCADIRK